MFTVVSGNKASSVLSRSAASAAIVWRLTSSVLHVTSSGGSTLTLAETLTDFDAAAR